MDKVVEMLWKGVHKLIFSEKKKKISKKLCKSAWQKGKYMVIYASCRRWGDVNTWKEKWKKLEKSFEKGIDKREEMWYTVKVAAIVVTEMILENWTTREKYKAYKKYV